jgi:hypothetical protein
MDYFQIYFIKYLNVSDMFSVHQQENLNTVYTQ